MKRIAIFNAIVLTVFCGLWYWGFYFSEHWMRVIDTGAPWTWLVSLCIISYVSPLLPIRKHSQLVWKSLAGPVSAVPVFWLWIEFCNIKFDPFY